MPTQKEILTDRLHDAINKKTEKRAKTQPVTPKSKPRSAKENPASKSIKSTTRKRVVKKEKKGPSVLWAKPKYHTLTDQLLTIIEENPRYRQAFGFSKEPGTNPTTGGQTLADLYTEVASELLLVDLSDLDLTFTHDDLPILQNAISNRISALKKLYRDYREELGQTGHGLVENDMADEIQGGTPLANVWDRIKSKFPWYERLNKLFGGNPAINRSAIANSQTSVDTSILDTTTKKEKKGLLDKRASSYDLELGSQAEASDEDSVDEDKSSEPESRCSSPPPARVEFTPARGMKRKVSMMDQITELANEDRSQRLKLIEVKQKEKTRRSQAKYQTQNELELARMRHQEQQAALQRQHDLVMMERQMELERLRNSNTTAYPQAPPAPGAYPGPAYGGRFGIDPNLS